MCSITRLSIFILFVGGYIASILICINCRGTFQQQRAKILLANPKYIKSVSLFTTRQSRKSPYVTDFNITSLGSWGNNVTVKLMFSKNKAKSTALFMEVKTCDMMKFKWAKDWVENFSNMSSACPLKKGTYRFTGFEVPPKNFPIPIGSGDFECKFLVYSTKTHERVLETSMELQFKN